MVYDGAMYYDIDAKNRWNRKEKESRKMREREQTMKKGEGKEETNGVIKAGQQP